MKRWYKTSGANSTPEEEKASNERIDAVPGPLGDPPDPSTWPTLSEVIAGGSYGTEAEMRSENTGIDWSDTLSETEERYRIPPAIQEIIRTHYPLDKRYEVGLIRKYKGRGTEAEIIPLVHWHPGVHGEIEGYLRYELDEDDDDDRELYRHMLFPATKYNWFLQADEFFKISGWNKLHRQKLDIGFYNDFIKPHLEFSSDTKNPSFVASIPIISIKPGQKFRDQKLAERFIRHTPEPLKATGYRSSNKNTGAPMYTVYSSRSLFEYRHPRRRTEHLDDRQRIRGVDTTFGNSADQDRYICVDQMWSMFIVDSEGPTTSKILITFQELIEPDEVLETRGGMSNEMQPQHALHEYFLLLEIFALKAQHEIIDIFQDAAADINFRISSNPIGDESLIQDCNSLLSELAIIIEITNSQLDVLTEIGRRFPIMDDRGRSKELYMQLTGGLEAIAGTFKGYQGDVKQTQDLLFQLLSTENTKQQVKTATQTAKETVIQVHMAEKAEEQSKSVLVFTIITTVFLPLSFFTSYYGMDATSASISDANAFWGISGPASVGIIVLAMALAFRGKIRRALAIGLGAMGLGKRPKGTSRVDDAQEDLERGLMGNPPKRPTFFLYPTGQKLD